MAGLAVAAILNSEFTNKMNYFSATSDLNITLRSLIFMIVMKHIQRWGHTRQNCRTFTKYATGPKSTLFTKSLFVCPEIENFLYIRKWINGKF